MVTLAAELKNVNKFLEYIRSIALANNINAELLMNLELSVEEAIVNIVSYAYEGKTGDVSVSCNVNEDFFVVQICDAGKEFNILEKKDPDINAELEDRHIGGLGIYFIKQLMDDVVYKRENGKNILNLKLKRNKL